MIQMRHTVQRLFGQVGTRELKRNEPIFEVERLQRIGGLCPLEWDLAAGSKPMSSFGWMLSVEQCRGMDVERFHLVARDSQGLAGAFECSLEASGHPASRFDETVFGGSAGVAKMFLMSCLPAVVVQKRIQRPGLSPSQAQQLHVQLVDAVEAVAETSNATVGFRQIDESDEKPLTAVLKQRSYCVSVDLPFAQLDLEANWRSFDDYRRELKQKHPAMESSIRRELNRGKRGGLEIRQEADAADYVQFYGLLRDHHLRLNRRAFSCGTDLLLQLKRNLGERLVLSVARIAGEIAGVSVGIRLGEAIAFPLIGIDQEKGKSAATYFNLGYNFNIDQAIAQGIRSIHFGTLVYETKVQRGCRLVPTLLYLRHANRLRQGVARHLLKLRSRRICKKYNLDRMSIPFEQSRS